MQKRAARVTLTSLLLVASAAIVLVLFTVERRGLTTLAAHDDVSDRLARMEETVSEIGVAQLGYLAPGQLDQPWFERTSQLIERLSADLSTVRTMTRSRESLDTLSTLTEAIGSLETADLRARQNLRIGQDLMAADVILSDGLNLVDTMTRTLQGLRETERAQRDAESRALRGAHWLGLGTVAILLTAGLLALVPLSKREKPVAPEIPSVISDVPKPMTSASKSPNRASRDGGVDLTSIAALCVELSRVKTADTLPELLRRAAQVVRATSLVLWVPAGDRLLPAFTHGCAPETIARLGPVTRQGQSAAATAWRTGERVIVQGSDHKGGALVVPLLGVDGCLGILALEVPSERERDASTCAIADLIAAQLATVVSVQPAAHQPSLESSAESEQQSGVNFG